MVSRCMSHTVWQTLYVPEIWSTLQGRFLISANNPNDVCYRSIYGLDSEHHAKYFFFALKYWVFAETRSTQELVNENLDLWNTYVFGSSNILIGRDKLPQKSKIGRKNVTCCRYDFCQRKIVLNFRWHQQKSFPSKVNSHWSNQSKSRWYNEITFAEFDLKILIAFYQIT